MIKLYFIGVIGLLVGVWFGLDGYMTSKQLSWEQIWIVWPLWVLLTFSGFLLGGVVLGIVAEYSFIRESKELEAQQEADKAIYKKSLDNDLKEEKSRLEREKSRLERLEKDYTKRSIKLDLDGEQKIKNSLKIQKRKYKAAMQSAAYTQTKAEQLITATRAENETLKKRALNACKMLQRIKEKNSDTSQ